MEVILQQDFPSLGYVGDRVAVRNGYARNYLIPRGIAVEAFSHNARLLNHRMAGIIAKRKRLKAEAEALASSLAKVELEFTLKQGAQGRSFGSITSKDIEVALKEKGFTIDRKQVKVTEQLRKAGTFTVEVKLHSEVVVPVTINVLAERSATAPSRVASAEEASEESPASDNE